MNQKRELLVDDWRRIRNALDLNLRCQLGQLKVAFDIFEWEFEQRTNDDPDIRDKRETINKVKRALERAEKEIALTAFRSDSASFGVKGLDDPIRQLIIQADLRCCNFADDVDMCPSYPKNCSAPTTGWCPNRLDTNEGGQNG